MMGPQQQGGARKYVGQTADGYDAKRENSPKWKEEDAIIRGMLHDLDDGAAILDIPFGTGRFIPYYEMRGFKVLGVDISRDMLERAAKKITKPQLFQLMGGDITDINLQQEPVFDAAVAVRITRWLSAEDRVKMMRGLQAVTRGRIIFTARVENHPHAYPIEDITKSLYGWHIARNEGIPSDGGYRVICLEHD